MRSVVAKDAKEMPITKEWVESIPSLERNAAPFLLNATDDEIVELALWVVNDVRLGRVSRESIYGRLALGLGPWGVEEIEFCDWLANQLDLTIAAADFTQRDRNRRKNNQPRPSPFDGWIDLGRKRSRRPIEPRVPIQWVSGRERRAVKTFEDFVGRAALLFDETPWSERIRKCKKTTKNWSCGRYFLQAPPKSDGKGKHGRAKLHCSSCDK